MPHEDQWDYRGFHEYLWANCNHHGILQKSQAEIAREFRVSRVMITLVMNRLEEEERIVPIDSNKRGRKRIRIVDPDLYTVARDYSGAGRASAPSLGIRDASDGRP